MATDDNDRPWDTSLFSRGTAVEAGRRRSLRRRSRRGVELPDRAAGRDRRRDRGAGDGGRARRSRADAAQPERRVRGSGARTARSRSRSRCCGAVDRCRRCASSLRNPGADAGFDALARVRRGARGLHVHRRVACPTACRRRSSARRTATRRPTTSSRRRAVVQRSGSTSRAGRRSGIAPWEDYEPESSLRAQWYRFDDPPRADDGTWDPLAAGRALRHDAGRGRRAARARGASAHVAAAERRLHRPRARRGPLRLGARGQPGPPRRRRLRVGRHGDVGPRAGPPRLVAYATQTMVFSFPK